jgi:hypothetical protein
MLLAVSFFHAGRNSPRRGAGLSGAMSIHALYVELDDLAFYFASFVVHSF